MRIEIKIEGRNYIVNQYENTLKYIKLTTVEIMFSKSVTVTKITKMYAKQVTNCFCGWHGTSTPPCERNIQR